MYGQQYRRRQHRAARGCLWYIGTWVIPFVYVGWPWAFASGRVALVICVVWLSFSIPVIALAVRASKRTQARRPVPEAHQGQRPPIPPSVRQAVWNKCGGRCRNCRISDADSMAMTGQHLQYDHIFPWSRGGPSVESNLQLLCPPCNRAKGADLPSGMTWL